MSEASNAVTREDGAAIQPLPEGGVLLHIGPPKTGTSALQGACHACRDEMRAQGVRYAGRTQQSGRAAYAILNRKHPSFGKPPPLRYWKSLVHEVRNATEPRVFVSSEFFSGANFEQATRIVEDLGQDRVHVAITLRPIAKILASRWQQNVQEGAQYSFEQWLRWVFESPAEGKGLDFWSRHQHDQLVARWASIVGVGKVSAIVVDDKQKQTLVGAFEALLALRQGTLILRNDSSNRSLTVEEVELIRALNNEFGEMGLSRAEHYKLVTRGAALYMKERPVGETEQKQVTPNWAIKRANEIGRKSAAAIRGSGIQVIGAIGILGGETIESETLPPIPPLAIGEGSFPSGSANSANLLIGVRAAIGLLRAGGVLRYGTSGKSRIDHVAEPNAVQHVHTLDLIRVILRRVAWRLRLPMWIF